ncbi:MAG: hypothetical protein GY756_17890 [bacterium]|nr:hypothetical protein [bacterium]
MKNTNSLRLEEFIQEKFKVSSHKLPYYIKWISHYEKYNSHNGCCIENIDSFIIHLQSSYQDWQVEQAEKAVTIYHSFLKNNGETKGDNTEDINDWIKILRSTKEEIRLQNKSIQIEKNYIYWIKKFIAYISNKPPIIVDQSDVKAYLTYLAVDRTVAFSTQKQVRLHTRAIDEVYDQGF